LRLPGARSSQRCGAADGPQLVDVARRAGVSTGTVSNVLNRPATVPEATRKCVQAAVPELGYVRPGATGDFAPHWRRTGFAAWLFRPAATGWYPRRVPTRHTRCRYSPTRGPECRCGGATRRGERRRAGCPSHLGSPLTG